MIRNTDIVPTGYGARITIDLTTNRKIRVGIQLVFVAIASVMVAFAVVFDFPLSSEFSAWTNVAVIAIACLVYMVFHELTHAGFLRVFSRMRPVFSLRFPYLAVGSRGYLNPRSFITVALAPAMVGGVILVTLQFTVPPEFFLTVYVVTILNFAGSAGDYFQAYVVAKLPQSALIQDDGVVTTVYLPSE